MTRNEMVKQTRDLLNQVVSKIETGINLVDTAIDSIPIVGDILSLPTKVAKVVVPNAIRLGGYVGAPIGVTLGEELKRKMSQPAKKGYSGVFDAWYPYGPNGDLLPQGGLLDKWASSVRKKGK